MEVGQEVVRARHVRLGLPVQPAVDGVVGALEQAVLAVDGELVTVGRQTGGRVPELAGPDHHRGGDVVFHLDLDRRREVLEGRRKNTNQSFSRLF